MINYKWYDDRLMLISESEIMINNEWCMMNDRCDKWKTKI